MKKLFVILLAVFMLTACSKNEDNTANPGGTTFTPVQGNSGSGEQKADPAVTADPAATEGVAVTEGAAVTTDPVNENGTAQNVVTEAPSDKENEAKAAFAKKLEEVYQPIKTEKISSWLSLIEYTFKDKDSDEYDKWGQGYKVFINSGYDWDKYNVQRQLYYNYADLDEDGVSELLVLINDPGIDWGWSNLSIYKYKDGSVVSTNDIACDFYWGNELPFKFYQGYNYIFTDEFGIDSAAEILELKDESYSTVAYGEEYNADAYRIIENGITKQSNKEQFESLKKKYLVNETPFTMQPYDMLANPVSQQEWNTLLSKIDAELKNKAMADGHISSTSNNYILDDIDSDCINEMIINDGGTLYVLDRDFRSTDYRMVREPGFSYSQINYYPAQKTIELWSQHIGNAYEFTEHYEHTETDYYSFSGAYGNFVMSWVRDETWIRKEGSDDYDYSASNEYSKDGSKISEEEFGKLKPTGESIWLNSYDRSENTDSEYILYGSDSRRINREELYGFDAYKCKLARNEIYARHGRMFENSDLQAYFNSKSWYTGWIKADNFDEKNLSDIEIDNINTIKQYEKDMNYNQ